MDDFYHACLDGNIDVDSSVDLSAYNNIALKRACMSYDIRTIKRLLDDPRVDPKAGLDRIRLACDPDASIEISIILYRDPRTWRVPIIPTTPLMKIILKDEARVMCCCVRHMGYERLSDILREISSEWI